MVVSRSDSKRRKKEEAEPLQESPKRTKVHAQRKFAQGSHLNSPVLTPVKDKDKNKYNGAAPSAELLPIKRPKTESFVNFLCFRGSDMLPKSLEFFNEPSIPEPLGGEDDKRDGASTSGHSRSGHRSSGDHLGSVAKAEAKNRSKSKSTAVQALKKKYQEQRMNKEKKTLTKLALKVKGKNMIRTRSAGPLDEKPSAPALQKKPLRTTQLVSSVKTKAAAASRSSSTSASRKPVLKKQTVIVKRTASKSVTRGGLRSSGGLPPGSDKGLKTERKPRKVIKMKPTTAKKNAKKPAIASSLSDFSSDDDQPLVKKPRVMSKASILAGRVTTRSRLMRPSSQATSSRLPRKTKEAATLFMEMLKKDLGSPDEDEDIADAMSVDSYEDIPKQSERRGSKDSTDTTRSEKKSTTKSVKKETKPNENKPLVRNIRKLPEKPAARLTTLKTRTLRRNSYRLVSKELELKRLKTTRATLITRMSSRSSSKEISQDSSTEVEKSSPKTPTSDRESRRERRSHPSRVSDSKNKQHKAVTKERDSSSSKKKDAPETIFDDSDEEPLGKKVNQTKSPGTLKSPKKTRQSIEKEGNSNDITVDVDQKLTRRRSLNTSKDISKEDKQSAQTSAKAQQAVKKKENEVKGKGKTESTSKTKSATSIPKPKQVIEGTNETSENESQNTKETEKTSAENKSQSERNHKKSTAKESESETGVKSSENSKNMPSQIDKTTKKSANVQESEIGSIETCSKDVTKVLTPANKSSSQPQNAPKEEDALPLKTGKINPDKCNNSNTNATKKKVSTKRGAESGSKNDLSSVSDSAEEVIDCDTKSSECLSSPEPNKEKVHSDKTTRTCSPLDTKESKIQTELAVVFKTLQAESEKKVVEKVTPNQSINIGDAKKKQSSSKKIYLNESILSDNTQKTKVEASKKDDVKMELNESKNTLTSSLNDMSMGILCPSDTSKDGSISQEIKPSNVLNDTKETIANASLNTAASQNLLWTKNVLQNQVLSSPIKGENNEVLKEENIKMPQVTEEKYFAKIANKSHKLNLHTKANEEDCKQSVKSEKIQNKTVREVTLAKNVQLLDGGKIDQKNPQITVDMKLNEKASCSKSSSQNEHDGKPDLKMAYPRGSTLVTNRTKCVLENKESRIVDVVVSKGADTQQTSQLTKQKETVQPTPLNTTACSGDGLKIRNVVLEPLLSRNLLPEVKCLPASPTLVPSDFNEKSIEQSGIKGIMANTKMLKPDANKSTIKQEMLPENSSKLGTSDMADKISSAVETLMSLKNVHKIDDKSFTIQTGAWNKSGQAFDVEHKRSLDLDTKRSCEGDQKPSDCSDVKKIKTKDSEVKRVTIQEPEFKRVTIQEPEFKRVTIQEPEFKRVTIQEPEFKRFNVLESDNKRPNTHESDFRRYQAQVQEHKPKPEHPQVLKGCSNPKSMLKPGTLIDIAGISHSPEIMTPLRPGVDGEIIPMHKPVRPYGQEGVDPFKGGVQGFKPFGLRWQGTSPEKNSKELLVEKESADSKSKTPVNESAWRLAFKNVKDPKSSNNVPTEKPVAKKQLSVTALAKKHKSKTEVVSDKTTMGQTSTSIPFLRQNKPFLGPSPTKAKEAGSVSFDVKKNSSTNVDPASLREKEAEVKEFLSQCGEYSRSLAPAASHVNPSTTTKAVEDFNRSSSIKSPYLPSSNTEFTQSEQITGTQHQLKISSDARQTSHKDQPEPSSIFGSDSLKRAGSPRKFEKQIKTGLNSAELSPINKTSAASTNSQQDQLSNKQTSSPSYMKPDQNVSIFQIDPLRRSSSPKSILQKSTIPGEQPLSIVGSQYNSPVPSSSKQLMPDKVRHFSPNRSGQSTVPDNFFSDSNLNKRTKSPTLLDSFSQQSNSPKGNSISRNTNSPVFGKCSTNIFKEIVPAKRSYSPTFLSSSQSDGESVPNVFSQTQNFRRSVSPLSNRSGFSKLVTTNEGSTETKKVKVDDKKLESSEESLTNRNTQASVSSGLKFPTEQEPNNSTVNLMSQSTEPLQLTKPVDGDNALVKEEVNESEEEKNSNIVTCEDSNSLKLDVKPFSPNVNEKQLASPQDNEGTNTPAMSEAKHRLPLPVEQTLKKLGNTRSSQNKKTSLQKVKSSEENVKDTQSPGIVSVQNEYHEENVKCTPNVFTHKMTTGIYSHNQEEELDLMQKKKVNMSAEEIKRWLNDSSTSEVVHRANCGILENDTCECEYRNTLTPSLQHIDSPKFETDAKNEVTSLSKPTPGSYDAIDKTKKVLNAELNVTNANVMDLRPSYGVKEKDDNTVKDTKNHVPYTSDPSCVTKQEPQKTATTPKKNTTPNQLKGEGLVSIKNFCVPVSVGSSVSTSTKQPTTPPVNKLRTFRLPNKNKDAEKLSTDTLDVSPPVRDDCSSSNELSSSNEETPEKSHERKSIFHQRRSALKVKERRELIAPSVNAFSPENESSVYAFDPELPPTSTPFRRSKGKDGKSTTTTDDEDMTPSSNSIAVQVNFDNEAVLECSTQTDVQEGDDDDTHTFYIPLQQSAADTSKPPLIQGVAVKVDTEGPDQKVIMRAKLVTKPLSTFNQSSPSPRGLIGTRSGKPEQKVRPLSVKPPVGTVQPTARPKPKPVQTQEEQPGPSKAATTCSPQAARLAKRIKSKAAVPSTSAENHPPKVAPAKLVEAPTFYPTEKEFEDPLEYISSITPKAEKYGLCRVVPPSNFKPECKVSDDMRFTAYNQYIHKMLHRWGPNVKEMLAIKKYLATQSIALTHPPWIGGMEVDLPRLYQTVQQCGGLKEVIEKKRWHRVADLMKIPKSAQDRVTKLDDIYCKFLLPYDTLSHVERTQLFEGVERDWAEREKRVANQQESENDEDEDSDSDSDSDIDECIVKGRSMALNGFYRIARNTMSMWFPKTDTPSAADVELEFWKHVASRQHHVCVHSGSIDSGAMGYGFPTGKNSSTSRHPWNLKMLTNNPGSILRFLGPIMGVTVPTLHVGMLFSACCWYRDPHGLPWIEYLHTGASKIWYGIPDSSSSQFRDAVMDIVPRLCRDKSLWLASDTAMVPPPLLVEKGVSLSRIVQDPGQFIVVFPKAFTSSICTGYLVSESVYYAQPSWLSTAQTLFNDLRESSEPTVFSLEKLLFTIVNDSRASMEVLHQILNIVVSLRDGEIAGRRQLEECGLNSSERLNSKRKGKARPAGDGEEDLECEECRMTLYISWMTNSQDGAVYCLPHAVELLSNKRSLVKHCTLVYAFSEEELEELVEKLKSRVENKNQKKSVAKGSKS